MALGAGLFLFKDGKSQDIQIIPATGDLATGEIIVHVDGAVTRPGVYKLKADARVNNAIEAAGGLSVQADSTKINLAATLAAGQQVHIPTVGESVSQSVGESVSQLVNINTASESELDKLPGIGPVTAQKIIASRPYSGLEELLTKKVVNTSVYEKIKDLIIY